MAVADLSFSLLGHPMRSAFVLLIVYVVGWAVYTRFFHPLAGIPGPFAASITRFWYVKRVRAGNFDHEARILHKQYGTWIS